MIPALCRLRSSSRVLRAATASQGLGNAPILGHADCQSTVTDSAPTNSTILQHSSMLGLIRSLRTSSIWGKSIEVEAPSMGESISEGTIASLLKKAGDAVEEDEAIAQIETDKVTIDVRAPSAGRLEEYRVAADDTVKVGQVVAVVAAGEGASASKAEESTSEPAESQRETSGQSGGEKQQGAEPDQPGRQQQLQQVYDSGKSHSEGRIPGIKFPRRRTDDGTRISLLPAQEQQQWHSESNQPSESSEPSEPPPSPVQQSSVSQREAHGGQPRKSPWYKGREQGTKLSQSRVLSEREMEMIELGGAA